MVAKYYMILNICGLAITTIAVLLIGFEKSRYHNNREFFVITQKTLSFSFFVIMSTPLIRFKARYYWNIKFRDYSDEDRWYDFFAFIFDHRGSFIENIKGFREFLYSKLIHTCNNAYYVDHFLDAILSILNPYEDKLMLMKTLMRDGAFKRGFRLAAKEEPVDSPIKYRMLMDLECESDNLTKHWKALDIILIFVEILPKDIVRGVFMHML